MVLLPGNWLITYPHLIKVIVPDLEKAMSAIISAVKESNVFAIVSGGWTAQQAERVHESTAMRVDVSHHLDCMYYVDSIPHEWLFTQVDAALHHGGAGTTAASMRGWYPHLFPRSHFSSVFPALTFHLFYLCSRDSNDDQAILW
jgi:sterol 3beta-glucosyltransferase